MSSSEASKTFNVPRTTLRNKIEGKSPIESIGHGGVSSILGNDTEKSLVDWILTCAKMGFPINREGLLSSVKKLVDEANLKTPFTNNRPGKKWFYSFMSRHKCLSQKHAEYVNRARGSVTEEKIRKWFAEVYELLEKHVDILKYPERIFNMDETCFYLAPKGELIIGQRGSNVYDEQTNSDKENITTLFATNALGTWAPPLTIYKYERIPVKIAQCAPSGWGIGKSENGWMTSESFYEYISNIFLPFLLKSNIVRPVIIFLDGHRSHLSLHLSTFCRENGLILIALYPNSTHILQPLDIAVFGPLKSSWKKRVKEWRYKNESELSKCDVPKALSEIMNSDKMPSNIISGFKHTGLYPFNPDNVDYSKIILRIEKENINPNNDNNHQIVSYLKLLEKNIDNGLLIEFKRAFKAGCEWDGDVKATMLYDVWSNINKNLSNKDCLTPMNVSNISKNQTTKEPLTPINMSNINNLIASSSTCQIVTTPNPQLNNAPSTSHASSSNIDLMPSRSLESVFDDIIKWPVPHQPKSKRKKEYLPSVITSDKWVEYHKLKEIEKLNKETLILNKKKASLEKKKEIEKKKIEKAEQKQKKSRC